MSHYLTAPSQRPGALLLVGFLLATACSNEPAQHGKQYQFRYRGEYYPSFMPPCIITIVARDSTQRITLRAYDDHRATPVTIVQDSAHLSSADLTFFFSKLDSIPVLKMRTKEQLGMDGITVYNTISRDSAQNKFQFWSPRKDNAPQEHKLVEAVLGLARRKFTTQQEQEYFESLEQYFDFGLPCKVTSTNPFEVRMYGSLSSNEERELTRFVQQLPSDRPILIDMTNFEGMGTMFYPLFRRLMTRNPCIVWVASKRSLEQLQELGVPAASITMTSADGRTRIKQAGGAVH
jgi:hypothetical protein